MTDYAKIKNGISKIIWGYFFLYFNINLGTISILPTFIAYILFLSAIELLKDEERELSLLRPLGVLLGIWEAIEWFATCVGYSFDDKWQFLNLIIGLVNLYFHFQFMTNLATIAKRYQQENCSYDKKLITCRTIQTIMLTFFLVITSFYFLFEEFWIYVSSALAVCYILVSIYIMITLNQLKNHLRKDEENVNGEEIETNETEIDLQ